MDDIIGETKGLVLVEHPMRDLDRIYSVYLAAKKHNRRYAVSMKIAFFLEILGELSPMKVTDVDIFVPLKGWGLIEKEEHDDAQKAMDYWGWERDYINRENSVTPKDIRENQSKYVLSTNLWQAKHLIDIQPEDAVWIKSTVMPFNIEMELNEKLKQNWLDHFGVKQLHAHASGHASRTEMKDMIAKINAKEVIPIHTENPEEL
ncbi:MAG: MBL fold metallo-hydrolase RNA specificity domain-containing protein [Promethearchaeota archaeon]